MKFSTLFALPVLATAALAQQILIKSPVAGSKVGEGSKITVEIERPDFQSSSQEVAVVIAMNMCRPTCFPGQSLGHILYNGPFNPQVPNPNPDHLQPFQNFTVQVPPGFMGNSVLTVTHVALIGAGPIAWMEEQNVTLVVL
ncbi:hypothetical protein HYDPIDRAFT_32931 [Hydnomerulius pinastri MD-312]|uniref:Phosphatidylglycerol/phosphatidylinositol transfer protein n=1 Tax=Hydnomerulius pinastri MD-312 TaxID=994086 RepID=A0A0C9VPX1_9AGAM|nr:hypothetical protein HYDPIDRAFT_32931 [Hydnomerulius pinastri MD-312]